MMPKKVILAGMISMMALANLSGCAYVSGLVYLFSPEDKLPAEYKVPEKTKVAILVDDYMSPLGTLDLKKSLASTVAAQLVAAKAVLPENMIETDKVFDVPSDSADGKKLSIQHIGREVGADYVIYINIIDFSMQSDPDNPLIQPKSRAYVKVIEVSSGERIWPIDVAGYPIEGKEHMQGEMAEDADKNEWSQKLIDKLALAAAELFYDHAK
jgi:hypothetical protein